MYSFLLAGRQLYGDYLVELFTQLLYPTEANASGGTTTDNKLAQHQQQQQQSLKQPEFIGLLFSLLTTLLGMALWWLLLSVFVLLILLAALHRPLPARIADRKKIAFFEFLMRLSNEYFGSLVEFVAGHSVRNKLSRALSYVMFPTLPRWLFRWLFGAHWCDVNNERIAGVKCRLYLPKGEKRRHNGAIVFIHGGFYDGALLYLSWKLGLPVISIDYSLSPEAKFPTALFECERVIAELNSQRFVAYGIDPTKIALMGDSAGANLCAVIWQLAPTAEHFEYLCVQCQVLVYPVIHMLNFRSSSYRYFYQSYPGTGLLNPNLLIRWCLMYLGIDPSPHNIRKIAQNRHLSKQLLGNEQMMALIDERNLPPGLPGGEGGMCRGQEQKEGKEFARNGHSKSNKVGDVPRPDIELSERMAPFLTNPDICPLLGTNLEGLCSAMICTAGVDILRDEGILYTQRLRQFGVAVEWKHYEHAYHGILNMCKSRQRLRILADISDYLQRKLIDC
uniref:Abhydrolase_3 domain-containing protein n=1 Tax=Globodera pallida TaxID=36090 RepID=A0A183CHI5_GLOPA